MSDRINIDLMKKMDQLQAGIISCPELHGSQQTVRDKYNEDSIINVLHSNDHSI